MDTTLLKKEMLENFGEVELVFPSDKSYDADCIIANLRFNYKPFVIAYCKNALDVVECIKLCTKCNFSFRIRSGGHQHEGMCSADGIFLIDLSKMNTIEYGVGNKTAWIPSGIPLRNVYTELESKNRIIPGGGCGSVSIGGLTQGGGWGPSARKLGLTCDNIQKVEIVLANGDLVNAEKDNKYADLFWAIKGGGGGNFGVVTRFLFNLTEISGTLTTFSLCWTKNDMQAFVNKWISIAHILNVNLTTFCRLSVVDVDTADKPSVLLGGQFYGTKADLLKILKPFYDIAKPFHETFNSVVYKEPTSAARQAFKSNSELSSMLQHSIPDAPKETCDAPHPHKISSTFPKENQGEELAKVIFKFLTNTKPFPKANTYLSLHGMGGKIQQIPKEDNAFPYKTKPYLLQFQAWWSDATDPDTANYMNWVENFRKALLPYTEGSFINFPDVNLVENYKTEEGRLKLLKFYYAENLNTLRLLKGKYDKGNLFSFGMSIPPL